MVEAPLLLNDVPSYWSLIRLTPINPIVNQLFDLLTSLWLDGF